MNITFFGDVMMGRSLAGSIASGMDLLYKLRHVSKVDSFNICNLEAPIIVGSPVNEKKFFTTKNDLNLRFFHGVTIANNHLFDQGLKGLRDTIDTLDEFGIFHTGAGYSKEEAFLPIIVSSVEYRAVVLGLTSVDNLSHEAKQYVNCIALLEDKKLIDDFLLKYKDDKTLLIVIPHIGIEHIDAPSPNVVRIFRNLITQGFDLIIGTHPHTVQGYEKFAEGVIFYSLGDFIFDSKHEKRKQSLAVNLTFDDPPGWFFSYQLLMRDDLYCPDYVSENKTQAYIGKLNRYIDNDVHYWLRYLVGKAGNQTYQVNQELRKNGIKGFMRYLYTKSHLFRGGNDETN